MPDVLDDYRELTVTLVSPLPGVPSMTIVSVDAPTSVEGGKTFELKINWENNGDAGTAWRRIIDLDTNQEILSRDTWSVAKGDSGTITVSLTMPSDRNLRLRVEVGHVE